MKLITQEDSFHIHKSLGIYVLCHYCFQFVYYTIYGNMNLNLWNMLPHIGLHLSSFIFKVIKKRIMTKQMAMFIWEELRLHSLIFSFRACFSILLPEYRILFIFFTMLLADITTLLLGDTTISTVRGNHERVSSNYIKIISAAFFSTSQMGATLICGGFFQKDYSYVLTFSTLPPIQTSAFGMTLIRKNIINKQIWQIVYGMELLLVYVLWYAEKGDLLIVPLSVFCYSMRRLNMNKYLLFSLITVSDAIWRQHIM